MTGAPGDLEVDLHRVRLPLRTPHVAAHGREERREVILVSLTDADGVTGWGECPTLARPGYGGEWTDGAWWVLRHVLAPQVGADAGALGVAGHPMASGAVRDAQLDLRLRRTGEGPEAVAGPLASGVSFGTAIGLDSDIPRLVDRAERAVAAGAALIVIKIAPGAAVAPLAAVRAALGSVAVAVDANGSFGPSDHDELGAIDELEPAFIEQPLPAEDLLGSARLTQSLAAPIALDEGVTSAGALEAAAALGAARVVTIKASRWGGVEAALAGATRAIQLGWEVHVGGMLESGLGRAAARVVAARAEGRRASMVGPGALLFSADVVEPVDADGDGLVPVPVGPGLAPPPDPDRLSALTVDVWRSR